MEAIVYSAIEREDIAIPLSELLDENGQVAVLPKVRARGYFDIRFRNNQLRLTAGHHVGQIPITAKVIIDVQPKVPIRNLVEIVGKSGRDVKLLDFYRRTYANLENPPQNLFEFLCRCLCLELRWIVKEGLYREYIQTQEATTVPRGRLQFGHPIAKRWCRGETSKLDVSYFVLTADTAHNRLIKYTLWYCLHHMKTVGGFSSLLMRELSQYYGMLASVTLDRSLSFLEQVSLELFENKLPFIRRYYDSIGRVCRTITENTGIDLMAQGADYETASFIINLADVFEDYVFYIAKRAALKYGRSIHAVEGNVEGKRYLFRDSTRFEAKPDVIFERDNSVLLILDAKYKNGLIEADRYQIISHALAYNTNVAIHVIPGTTSSTGLEYVGTIGKRAEIRMYLYRLDIESKDLEDAEDAFSTSIVAILAEQDSIISAA